MLKKFVRLQDNVMDKGFVTGYASREVDKIVFKLLPKHRELIIILLKIPILK